MSATTWLQDIQAAVVTVLANNSDLAGLAASIEAGIVTDLINQDMSQVRWPAVQVFAKGFGDDKDSVTYYANRDVSIIVGIGAIGASEFATSTVVQQIGAQVDLVVGQQRTRTPGLFSLANSTRNIADCRCGTFDIIDTFQRDADATLLVLGQYRFPVEYRLNIA